MFLKQKLDFLHYYFSAKVLARCKKQNLSLEIWPELWPAQKTRQPKFWPNHWPKGIWPELWPRTEWVSQ